MENYSKGGGGFTYLSILGIRVDDGKLRISSEKFFFSTTLDILFSSNHNIHKSSSGHWFWASDPLIDRFY